MRLIIRDDKPAVGGFTANYIAKRINEFQPTNDHPRFVLGLPTGSSPLPVYHKLIDLHNRGKVSFKHVITFNMDDKVDIEPHNAHILDGEAENLVEECARYEEKIEAVGGIDLFLGGIGEDGHIAFNEPGSSLASRTRMKTLAYDTIVANARFFDNDIAKVPKMALTVGIATVMDAREVIIVITGKHKAPALAKSIEEGVNHMWTVSAIQQHPWAMVVADEDATLELRVGTVRYFKSIESVQAQQELKYALANPFALDRPETLEHTLDAGATCAAYNHGGKYKGTLLATGRFDGFVNIWDMLTLAPLRVLEAHVKAVVTVSWSANSRYLLSACRDWSCVLWDVETGERVHTIKFDAPVQEAFLHPFISTSVVATLSTQQTYLVDLSQLRQKEKLAKTEIGMLWETDSNGQAIQRSQMTTAMFSPSGRFIVGGTSQGCLLIFELPSLNVISETAICNGAIKRIAIDNRDRLVACTSRDRTIRVASISDELRQITTLFRFADEIDRTIWNGVTFSNDNEYIIGGSGHKAGHYIYIWDTTSGTLIKVVEGPRSPLHDVIWHPTKPHMASIDSHGQILTWTTNNKQRWAAFAPGFEELETNIEYKEKEDEFDIYVDQDNKVVKGVEDERAVDVDGVNEGGERKVPEYLHGYVDIDDDYNFFPSQPDLSDVEQVDRRILLKPQPPTAMEYVRGKQDLPPPGGFETVKYKRSLPLKGPSGAVIFGTILAISGWGFYKLGQGNLEMRELEREKIWSRINIVPALMAENDRDIYRRERAAMARESEIMKDVKGWQVGQSVYNGKRYNTPSMYVL
ncbi:hypothetical protein E3P86_00303 [Wallemia ichthyophaga]|uniref:glucosamine-6-phosphate deaminase n=2 Tax=Wallemia ichthyophaga TaxID=245174 RepID=A0A4T0JIW4_WALIC|nr:hypothetical protein E3P86_00303 [Wallemia ichthyophaga]